jgi:hypothetical protein
MKEFFIDIRELLLSVEGVAYVQKWNNQLARIMKEGGAGMQMFPMPAVFPAFNTSSIMQLGEGVQMYDPFEFELHVLDWQIDAGDGSFEQNLEVYDLVKRIQKKVQKFQPGLTNPADLMGSCIRVGETEDNDHNGVTHFIIRYRTAFVDDNLQEPVDGLDSVDLSCEVQLTVKDSQDPDEPYKYTFQ